MSDLTPPPEEQMPEPAKARIREGLLAATHETARPHANRWLAPVVAAATVLGVIGLGSYLVTGGGSSADPAGLGPAASSTSSAPTDPAIPEEPDPTEVPSLESTTSPEKVNTVPEGEDTGAPEGQGRARTCTQEMRTGGPSDAVQVAEIKHGKAATSFWVGDSQWEVCDDLSAIEQGGRPAALLEARDNGAPYAANADTLGFSSATITDAAFNPRYMHFFAGGRLFAGVDSIAYSFPDGGEALAEVTTDGSGEKWWAMSYEAHDGVFMAPDTNFMKLDPVQVVVSYTNGATQQVELRFGRDDCAHVNFGC